METNIENPKITQAHDKPKFNRANISQELFALYEEGKLILEERKVEVNFSDFSAFIAKALPKGIVNSFVDEMTPTEWHLQNMMANPEYKQEFLKLAEKLKKR